MTNSILFLVSNCIDYKLSRGTHKIYLKLKLNFNRYKTNVIYLYTNHNLVFFIVKILIVFIVKSFCFFLLNDFSFQVFYSF